MNLELNENRRLYQRWYHTHYMGLDITEVMEWAYAEHDASVELQESLEGSNHTSVWSLSYYPQASNEVPTLHTLSSAELRESSGRGQEESATEQ